MTLFFVVNSIILFFNVYFVCEHNCLCVYLTAKCGGSIVLIEVIILGFERNIAKVADELR